METDLKGKNVLVTEVGNPLGRSSALAFAREGANLVLGSLHDSDSLIAAQQETAALGVKVVAAIYEAASEDGVKQFVQRGLDEFGHIDVLLNNMAWAAAKQSFAAMSFEIGYGGFDGLDNFPGAYPVSRLNDPLARYGTGQEVSSAAIYLASEDAGYITGQCYLVNGGKYFL